MIDKRLLEDFEFRYIHPDEAEQAAAIEKICFSPDEACSGEAIAERVLKVPDLFLTAVDLKSGRMAGFLSGIRTMETSFRDEFFSDADLHDPDGVNVMLVGLAVLPEYRGRGLGSTLMSKFLLDVCAGQKRRGFAILTCDDSKVSMYEKMGFTDHGLSGSVWGGKAWHEMSRMTH